MPWFVLAASFAAIYARLLRGQPDRGDVRGLHPHGARQGAVRARGDPPPRHPRGDHADRDRRRGSTSACCSAARSSPRPSFNIPGIGRLAYDSIQNADLPMIQGTVLFGAFFILIANLIVDIVYAFIDPRVGTRERARCSRSRTCASQFPTDDGVVHAVDGISYSVDDGQDARHRRRVRLGEDRLVTDDDGADPRAATTTHLGADHVRGTRPAQASRRGAAADPRQRHRDDLPGSAVLAAPLLQGRLPARGGDPRPPGRVQGGRPRSRDRACSSWSGSPTRADASTSTRTSSPAACASGR